MPENTLWTTADVARYLRTSDQQVLRLIDDAGLPHTRISERIIRFDPEEVRRWAASNPYYQRRVAGGGQ